MMQRRLGTLLPRPSRRAGLALAAAALATAGTLGACSDKEFLTEVPYDFVGPTNFYRTAGDALAGLNGAYASLTNFSTGGSSPTNGSDNYYGRNLVMLVEYPAEALTTRLSATNERTLTDVYTYTPGHSYIYSVWQG